ncbi:MAG: Asp-tRNA(Asn)/Glu-tRNA(Gln) amidotransferase subunit GatC [Candidatus Aenigmarchaeota archaeon]|nr:Asp-tRNA(Asn)/Glu-tRNA(Gln) amidotransferase subunit GatC [Candidatus Aenigmarchaeota archaeon]
MAERIDKVSGIARLELTAEEKKKFEKDLDDILNSFRKLSKIDTTKTEPTFQPVEVKNVMRKDIVEESLSQKEALANAKDKKDGCFRGPRAI